jgi:hypothetical protein
MGVSSPFVWTSPLGVEGTFPGRLDRLAVRTDGPEQTHVNRLISLSLVDRFRP